MTPESDLAHCREAIKHGSKSFYAASRLLPGGVRDKALALYAFCRMADDAVDLVFCSRLLHHFEHSAQRVDVMRELARVSRRWLIASYFDAACFQAWRNRVRGRFRGRWPVPQRVFESDAANAGWQVRARRAMLPGISEQVWLLMERKEWAGS